MSSSLWPHGLQHSKLPCPSLSPGVCWNSCPLDWWSHPIISSCHPLLLLLSIFPSIRIFSNELAHHIMGTNYWNFSISSSNEYSGLISIRIDWFDLLAVQGTLKSLPQHHSFKAYIPPFFWWWENILDYKSNRPQMSKSLGTHFYNVFRWYFPNFNENEVNI